MRTWRVLPNSMTRKTLTRRSVLAGIGAASVATVGTAAVASTDGEEMARVRVAHASPDAPAVDVFVRPADDGEYQELVGDVNFGSVTGYLSVAAGSYDVAIAPAGSTAADAVFETTVEVEAGTDYTLVALGELDEDGAAFDVAVFKDDNSVLDTDTARVRVLHASPDAPEVDVTANDGATTLFDGVSFGESSGYTEVPADEYTVEIREDTRDEDGDVVLSTDLTLSGGEVYTVFALGYLTPDDEPADEPLRVLAAVDASPAPARVTIDDQTVDPAGGTAAIEVAQVTLSEGGFVVLHDETLLDGQVTGSVIGNSAYLQPGSTSGVGIEVAVDDIVDANDDGTPTVIAMAHKDTDGDQSYGFPLADGPYVDPDDTNGDGTETVLDSAAISFESDDEDEEDDDEDDDDGRGPDEDGPGRGRGPGEDNPGRGRGPGEDGPGSQGKGHDQHGNGRGRGHEKGRGRGHH